MPRPLNEQVIVITGASSGIGRETALQFGRKGSVVILAARNVTGLEAVAGEIQKEGGTAYIVPTDVSSWEQVEQLAQQAVTYGEYIDTWVNCAAVALYGKVPALEIDEIDQVVRVNLLGTIYGAKAALGVMKRQGYGTIINVGSTLSHRSVPLQSIYCASKHGVKGFTDSLRLELKHEKDDINVVLILPASINTPFFDHARSKMDVKPMPIPPVYPPSVVSDTIVHAAYHPHRDLYAGGASRIFSLMERISPALADQLMLVGGWAIKFQRTDHPNDGRDNLFAPMEEYGRVEGEFGHITKPSLYTRYLGLMPTWQRLLVPFMLLGAWRLLRQR